MGFPRILSKNNKIYTKLGEFCLSSDGNHFWIVCHTCQEELQTQDQFWKHIQDEHNFMGAKQEYNRNTTSYGETETTTEVVPLPLYRKVNLDEQRVASKHEDDSPEQQEAKDYTEMRGIEQTTNSGSGGGGVEIDIKVEPTSMSQTIAQPLQLPPPPIQTQVEISAATPTVYQLPSVPQPLPAVPPYSSHNATLATLNMAVMPQVAALLPQELPKDSNSTTASASSAISSDDGERWYICDYETCGLKFKYQSRLELHRSVHSKERRFACELCGASFKQSCNLSTHRKKKHFLKGSKSLVQQRY